VSQPTTLVTLLVRVTRPFWIKTLNDAQNRIADGLKAPRNGWELSKTAVLSRPPPSEIRLRKTVSGPEGLPSRPKVVPVGAKDGLGEVIESPQVAFDASACVSLGGAHADQKGPVTGLSQQQFPARTETILAPAERSRGWRSALDGFNQTPRCPPAPQVDSAGWDTHNGVVSSAAPDRVCGPMPKRDA
jgi:hypothetical protein